jgi:hypothetical protein
VQRQDDERPEQGSAKSHRQEQHEESPAGDQDAGTTGQCHVRGAEIRTATSMNFLMLVFGFPVSLSFSEPKGRTTFRDMFDWPQGP